MKTHNKTTPKKARRSDKGGRPPMPRASVRSVLVALKVRRAHAATIRRAMRALRSDLETGPIGRSSLGSDAPAPASPGDERPASRPRGKKAAASTCAESMGNVPNGRPFAPLRKPCAVGTDSSTDIGSRSRCACESPGGEAERGRGAIVPSPRSGEVSDNHGYDALASERATHAPTHPAHDLREPATRVPHDSLPPPRVRHLLERSLEGGRESEGVTPEGLAAPVQLPQGGSFPVVESVQGKVFFLDGRGRKRVKEVPSAFREALEGGRAGALDRFWQGVRRREKAQDRGILKALRNGMGPA